MVEQQEITMELLTDIGAGLKSVSKDFLPTAPFTVKVEVGPPACVVLRIPGRSFEDSGRAQPLQALLKELAEAMRDVTDRVLPSLPLRYMVIGGSEASGIEITVKPGTQPVYGHVIKAKLAWAQPSNEWRRRRPNLPERIPL